MVALPMLLLQQLCLPSPRCTSLSLSPSFPDAPLDRQTTANFMQRFTFESLSLSFSLSLSLLFLLSTLGIFYSVCFYDSVCSLLPLRGRLLRLLSTRIDVQ